MHQFLSLNLVISLPLNSANAAKFTSFLLHPFLVHVLIPENIFFDLNLKERPFLYYQESL